VLEGDPMLKIRDRWREFTATAPPGLISHRVSIAYFAIHACVGLLCAFAPRGIGSSTAIRYCADLLDNLIPSIGGHIAISSFPDHTRLTLAVLWTCVPISAVIVARVPWFWIPNMTAIRRHPSLLLAGALLFGFIILTMMLLTPDASDLTRASYGARMVQAMSTSRILLGVIAGLMCSTVAWCIAMLFRLPSIAREAVHDDFR
jgi:hypothetical protein